MGDRIWTEHCSNMAGFEWTWHIYLEGAGGGWTLHCELEEGDAPDDDAECEDGEDCEGCDVCEGTSESGFDPDYDTPSPVRIVGDAVAFYEGLRRLVEELGGDFGPDDAARVAARVKALHPDLAAGLYRHARRLAREEAAAKEAAAKEAAAKEAARQEELARAAAAAPAKGRRKKAPTVTG
jgi:hypothetical protein